MAGKKAVLSIETPKRCSHNIDVIRGTRSPALLENTQTHTFADQDWRPPRCLTPRPAIAFPMPIPPILPSPNPPIAGDGETRSGGMVRCCHFAHFFSLYVQPMFLTYELRVHALFVLLFFIFFLFAWRFVSSLLMLVLCRA